MLRYDFGSGRTDPSTFPYDELAEAARRAIPALGEELVLYPGDYGHRGLREVMAAREAKREGVEVSADDIALMNGSMQAVTLVAEALLEKPGDVVVCEELTYSGTLSAYKALGAHLVGVPVDGSGMRTDALEQVMADLHAQGTPPRFIYTLTTYQNPTGTVMPRARRLELLEIAKRYDAVVVEDNCYADVHFEGPIEPSLYALDDYPNQIYLCSLSKILGPGIRLGYLKAPPALMQRLLARRFDGGNSVLAAAVCAEFFRDSLWDHVLRSNVLLKQKRDLVFAGLETAADCTFTRPVGGMFVWVGFPEDVDRPRLWSLLQEEGVGVARGSAFHIDNADIPFLRLAFGYAGVDAVREGVPRLVECIERARSGNDAVAAG